MIGLQLGAIYSLVALGLALVYKATRVLNFAHGEIGTTAAFFAYVIMVGGQLEGGTVSQGGLLLATLPAIGVGVLLGISVNALIGRVRRTTPVTWLVSTVAIALILVAFQIGIFEARARGFPRYIRGAPCFASDAEGVCTTPLTIGGQIVSWHTILILLVLGVTALLLAVFFRTPPGVALLATSQDPFAAELQGVSVRAMTMLAWGAAGGLAAIAGLLGAGIFEIINPAFMLTTFLIPGFVAAVLGGMNSMLGAVAGGLLMGLTVSTANQVVSSLDIGLPGPPQVAVLVVLLAVLFLRPRGIFGKEA